MSILTQRVKNLMDGMEISQATLASSLGISGQRLSGYLTGRAHPNNDIMVQFADILGTTVDYLLGVSDDMTPYLSAAGYKSEGREFIYNDLPSSKTKTLDMYASIPWGRQNMEITPYATMKLGSMYEYLKHALYVIFIKDDSARPDFIENDAVYIEAANERIDGRLYAIRASDDGPGFCLRRCVFNGSVVILSPPNPQYLPDIIDMDKCGFDPIAGRPFWLYRETLQFRL